MLALSVWKRSGMWASGIRSNTLNGPCIVIELTVDNCINQTLRILLAYSDFSSRYNPKKWDLFVIIKRTFSLERLLKEMDECL